LSKIFIDLGAYHGQMAQRFLSKKENPNEWECILFECNPLLSDYKYSLANAFIIKKAAWIEDGEIPFYLSKTHPAMSQGSSCYEKKLTGNLDKERPVNVQTIDFSQWLKDRFDHRDYIVLKMNIEGAEYKILPKMFLDGTINLISEIYIQWHWQKIQLPVYEHTEIERELKSRHLIVHDGYSKDLKK